MVSCCSNDAFGLLFSFWPSNMKSDSITWDVSAWSLRFFSTFFSSALFPRDARLRRRPEAEEAEEEADEEADEEVERLAMVGGSWICGCGILFPGFWKDFSGTVLIVESRKLQKRGQRRPR